jgi:heme A synthase
LHMAHRLLAFVILSGVALAAWRVSRALGRRHLLTRLAAAWLGLILTQVALGAATVWTGQSPTVATLHVVGGALALAAGSLGTLAVGRWCGATTGLSRAAEPATLAPDQVTLNPSGTA